MSVVELLDTLANQGVELWFEGERLRFRAPKGALTPDQRAQLSSRRPEVLAQLRKNAAVTRDFPLSFSQRSLWFVHQENPSSAAYNVAFQARVVSAVDVAALRQALQAVLDRHAALRTTYPVSDGVPVQRVAGTTEVAFTVLDARADDDTAFHERIRTDYRRPFDLESGPLFRATLFSRNPQEHVLLLVAHHVAADGWSLLQLLEELRVLYAEATGGAAALLPRPEVQYSDFTAWQAETLAGPEGDRLEQYWTEQLAVAPANLDLPSDRPRPVRSTPDGVSLGFELDERLSTAVRQLARTENTTPFVILLAAFKTLLSRYTGREDIIVGTPTFGRNRPEFARVIGDFVNTLPLRSSVDGNLSFRDFTSHVRQTLFDALAAQEYPFPLIVEKVQPVRDPGRSPLFDIMFVLQRFDMVKELESVMIPRADAEPVDFGGLRLTHYPLAQQLGQFDLTLEIVDGVGALTGHFKYNPDLFDGATIARISDHFRVLLEGIVEDPARPLGALPLLTRAERESAAPVLSAPHEAISVATLHARFEDQVARTPDAIAVTFDGSSLTYAELNRRANRLAGRLRELGVQRDTLVGLCAERSLELVIGVIGILKAGGAYLPIDLSYPQERVAFMIEDAAVRVLVTQRALQDRLASLAATAVLLDDELPGYSDANLDPASGPDDLAYVIYTSGSTGKPKGTMVTHRAVDRLFGATDAWFRFGSTDVWTLFHSIAFDFSVWELWGPLRSGGRLVVVPFLVSRTPEAFLELVRREGVTMLNQTPSAFGQLIAADMVAGPPRPTQLRYVIFGGEKLHLPSLQPWMDRYGDTTPTLVNMYGITETCVHVTYRPLTRRDLTAHMGSSIGVPIPDLRVHVLDARGQLVPVGVPGELYVGGPGLARGYLNRAGLTAERFIADPFTPGGRLYRTGDVGRWRTSGELEYLGRLDSQVKLRGFRIELGEIEAAIARTAGVRLCAVALREDRAGDQRLVAYIDCTGARDAVLDAVRSHLAATLPDYMRPAAFVFLDALPLTENGKIDRRALPAPDLVTQGNASVATPPETATERELARIWEEVLGIEDVGREDNFFELGGHSLLATQVASRIRTIFRCEFALRALFETPVLAALARQIEQEVAGGAGQSVTEIERVTFDGPSPLSFSQERMWVLHQMDPASAAYNIPAALHLRGSLDRPALEHALATVVSRHEALRTTYALAESGDVTQVVHDGQLVPLVFQDLRTIGVDASAEAIARMASDNRIPFDLLSGPVLKVTLLRVADDEHFLLLSMHHIAGDQWALGVIGRELAQAYNAYRAHVEPGLPDLPIRYRDFAVWQRRTSHRDRLQTQLAYWRKQLAGATNALEMPTDFVRPAVGSGRGAILVEPFPREFSEALRAFSREHHCTMSMTLLAAFVTLLHRYTGQDDISVAMPIANREQLAIEPLVGLFVNTLILRTAPSNELSFVDLLHRVRETVLDAFANQDLPFEKLVEELRSTLDASRAPLAQVLFNVQNAPMGGIVFDELTAEPQFLDRGAAQFDIGLSIDAELTHTMFVEYSTDLFSVGTMARLLSHYRCLLESILADPSESLGALAMVALEEVEHVARAASSVEPRVRGETLHTIFEEWATRTPDAVAVTFEASSLTYSELNRRANRLAHRLRMLGVRPGALVGLCFERSLDLLVGLLGIVKAGGAYVPIDLAYPADRIAFVLTDSGAAVLVTHRPLEQRFAGQATTTVILDDDFGDFPDANPVDLTSPDDLAYVIYTSGSTGRPKGVEVEHRNVVRFLDAMRAMPGCTAADVLLAVTTVAFDIAGLELWLPLSTGARVVLAARGDALDGERLGALIAQHGVTLLQATPATWRLLLDAGWAGTPTLTALCGGEALPRDLAAALVPRVRALWNMYGPTETTIWSTLSRIADAAAPITIGHPIAGTRVYVVEPSGQLAPAGVPGELCIAGAGVARGYHARPELTAEKFTTLTLPGGRAERVYHTGDIVRARPDGTLEYRGRRDQQIKLRGYRIELGEIEAVLARAAGGRPCAVALRADRPGDPRLVAYVVPDPGVPFDADAARTTLRGTLPEYMIPSAFVELPELPLTPNGKVDRKALPAPAAPAPRAAADVLMTPPQRRVADIWQVILHLDRVGLHDNFFDVGGHSLLLIKLHAALKSAFNVDLMVVELFQHTTVATQASRLSTAAPTDAAVRRAQARAARQIDG